MVFGRLKSLFGGAADSSLSTSSGAVIAADLSPNDELRIAAMVECLGDADQIFMDREAADPIHIVVFDRDFSADEDEVDNGFVLVTCGMSDRAMPMPDDYDGEESPRVELIWYVREVNEEYVRNVRWLAKLPHFDQFLLGSGHRVPMPEPILSFSDKTVFMTLSPIVSRDRDMLDDIEFGGCEVHTLAVHLLTDDEHSLVKTDEGFDAFLDLMDENDYPIIFDPQRPSYA
jgi:Suppressor of fused protein (SUFU)